MIWGFCFFVTDTTYWSLRVSEVSVLIICQLEEVITAMTTCYLFIICYDCAKPEADIVVGTLILSVFRDF